MNKCPAFANQAAQKWSGHKQDYSATFANKKTLKFQIFICLREQSENIPGDLITEENCKFIFASPVLISIF